MFTSPVALVADKVTVMPLTEALPPSSETASEAVRSALWVAVTEELSFNVISVADIETLGPFAAEKLFIVMVSEAVMVLVPVVAVTDDMSFMVILAALRSVFAPVTEDMLFMEMLPVVAVRSALPEAETEAELSIVISEPVTETLAPETEAPPLKVTPSPAVRVSVVVAVRC